MIDNGDSPLRLLGLIFGCIGAGLIVFALLLLLAPEFLDADLFLWLYPLVLFAVGAAFLLAGGICYFIYKTGRDKKNALLSEGAFVLAEVEDIDIDIHRTVRVDRIAMNPYFILCRHTDDAGNEYRFKSKGLLYNPSGLMKGSQIKVYVNLANPGRYYVDTNEILPEKAILHKFKFDSDENSNKLLRGGKYVLATTCGVELVGRIKVNGMFKPMLLKLPRYLSERIHVGTDEKGRSFLAYSVLCRYDAPDGDIHIFASKGVWGEPERDYVGDPVKVYYEGKNYRRYHVDLDSIS